MKKVKKYWLRVTCWTVSCIFLYHTVIMMIAINYYQEAKYNYDMGVVEYTFNKIPGYREKGKAFGLEGDRLKKKGDNTLLWIPPITRNILE